MIWDRTWSYTGHNNNNNNNSRGISSMPTWVPRLSKFTQCTYFFYSCFDRTETAIGWTRQLRKWQDGAEDVSTHHQSSSRSGTNRRTRTEEESQPTASGEWIREQKIVSLAFFGNFWWIKQSLTSPVCKVFFSLAIKLILNYLKFQIRNFMEFENCENCMSSNPNYSDWIKSGMSIESILVILIFHIVFLKERNRSANSGK